ncbi:hypothetical protein AOPFMNJM_0848 [Methylobacterium jeotgali]|uniref:IS6 family transposase n=1 Tax=Methylobacterium jeotgali TaxID=381630 RepID=A0ABQ4SSW6_9HYPH|nr:hypothetical protein AwMethylo_08720 [Methylobacterium sp.]GJE05548.1 hypothetical protein AOPFMNJM_0848 [Methylobacterium jeotgali]
MSESTGPYPAGEIVLWAMRWSYCYGVSYRDLEQMMVEHGVPVDRTTIYCWVQRYAPEIETRLRNPDQLCRLSVGPAAATRQSQAASLASTG